MISKAKQRLIKSLQSKKIRQKQQLFLVQGEKGVVELLRSSLKVRFVLATDEFMRNYFSILNDVETSEVSPSDLRELGTLEVNDSALAVAEIPDQKKIQIANDELVLMLDSIKDPGNLGTIIRTADWFGIRNIIASKGTVDMYNPKVINSTMGSFIRVKIQYEDLESFIDSNPLLNYYGADMEGTSASSFKFERPCAICLGSESHGISDALRAGMNDIVSISRVGEAESLNVAIAAGILMQLACK